MTDAGSAATPCSSTADPRTPATRISPRSPAAVDSLRVQEVENEAVDGRRLIAVQEVAAVRDHLELQALGEERGELLLVNHLRAHAPAVDAVQVQRWHRD